MVGFGKGKNKIAPLDPLWVKWFEDQIALMSDNAFLSMPLVALQYQISKKNKTAILVAVAPKTIQSRSRQTTERILGHLGFVVTMAPDAVKETFEEMMAAFAPKKGQKILVSQSVDTSEEIKRFY